MFVDINQISIGRSFKYFCKKWYAGIDFENGLFYCYFALSAMEKYLVESLLTCIEMNVI